MTICNFIEEYRVINRIYLPYHEDHAVMVQLGDTVRIINDFVYYNDIYLALVIPAATVRANPNFFELVYSTKDAKLDLIDHYIGIKAGYEYGRSTVIFYDVDDVKIFDMYTWFLILHDTDRHMNKYTYKSELTIDDIKHEERLRKLEYILQ